MKIKIIPDAYLNDDAIPILLVSYKQYENSLEEIKNLGFEIDTSNNNIHVDIDDAQNEKFWSDLPFKVNNLPSFLKKKP